MHRTPRIRSDLDAVPIVTLHPSDGSTSQVGPRPLSCISIHQRLVSLSIGLRGEAVHGRRGGPRSALGHQRRFREWHLLSARIPSLWISGVLAKRSPAFAFSIKAAATLPLRCASRPASSSNVSKMAKEDGPS
jgi:hypothetical protein